MRLLATPAAAALSSILTPARATPVQVLPTGFPDPAVLNDPRSGHWYAFATAGNGRKAANTGIWAPDVRHLAASRRFVMYYSAPYAADTKHLCVGAATADSMEGPYHPTGEPLACPIAQGGAIGYWDEASGTRWVIYKVDGNADGSGGSCNNGNDPIHATPIMLQQVDRDGFTLIKGPMQVLDRGVYDGPLIEAPNLIRASDGTYIIFFTSNCYSTPLYDIRYATSQAVTGPYTKSSTLLLVIGDWGLTAPGGAQSIAGGNQLVFHANCGEGRCMFQTSFSVSCGVVTIT